MTTAPLVSILIPAHNSAPWLGATIESALAQTWPRVEIIVVENNSTDDTLAIARRFVDRGVRVISSARTGAAAARNLAFGESRGDLIQYLDADDLLSPDKVAIQAAALGTASTAVSLSARCEFFDGDDPALAPVHRGWPFVPSDQPREWLATLYGAGGPAGFIALHQWLTPRALVASAGPWNETLTVNDDGEFFCRVLLRAERIRTDLDGVAYYRRHRSSRNLSSGYQRNRRHVESMLAALDLLAARLLVAGSNPALARAFARHYAESAILIYPLHPALSREAERKALALDPALSMPAATSRLGAALRRCFGWRFERRLAHWYRALRSHP